MVEDGCVLQEVERAIGVDMFTDLEASTEDAVAAGEEYKFEDWILQEVDSLLEGLDYEKIIKH
jgi:hypothetical protein